MLLSCILYTPSVFCYYYGLTNDKIHILIKFLSQWRMNGRLFWMPHRYMNVLKQLLRDTFGYSLIINVVVRRGYRKTHGGEFRGKISHYLCLVVCTSLFLQFRHSISTLLNVRTGVWGKLSHYLFLFVCTSLFLQFQHSIRTLLKVQTGSGDLPQKKIKLVHFHAKIHHLTT